MIRRSGIAVLALAFVTACGQGSTEVAGDSSSPSVASDGAAVTTTMPPDPNTSQPPTVVGVGGPIYPPTSDVEATDIPFEECNADNGKPVPVGDELARLEALRQQITDDGLFDQPFISSSGGPAYGALSVGLSRRHQPSIDWLRARAEPEDLCIELPPLGFYDRPYEEATWVLDPEAPEPGASDRSIAVLVDSTINQCGYWPQGRILQPVVEYGTERIEIRVPLDHVSWGPHPCPGWFPDPFVIELDEPIGDRTLVRPS